MIIYQNLCSVYWDDWFYVWIFDVICKSSHNTYKMSWATKISCTNQIKTQKVTWSDNGSVYKGKQPNGNHCMEFVFDQHL